MAPLIKETIKKIAEGALKDEEGDDEGTVKPGARPTAAPTDDDEEEGGDFGTMVTNEEYGTMISNDGEGDEPDFMELIRMGMGGKVGQISPDFFFLSFLLGSFVIRTHVFFFLLSDCDCLPDDQLGRPGAGREHRRPGGDAQGSRRQHGEGNQPDQGEVREEEETHPGSLVRKEVKKRCFSESLFLMSLYIFEKRK